MEDEDGFAYLLRNEGVCWLDIECGQVVQFGEHTPPALKISTHRAVEIQTGRQFVPMPGDLAIPYDSYRFERHDKAWVCAGKLK